MFRIVLSFTFLGPLLGGIITSLSLAENNNYISVMEGIVASVFWSPITGLFGYPLAIMIGGVPAMFSGVLYGALTRL